MPDRPRSEDDARMASEPAPEQLGPCLLCSDPATERDAIGTPYCARHWRERAARMRVRPATRVRRLEPTPTGSLTEAMDRISRQLEERRLPWRDRYVD